MKGRPRVDIVVASPLWKAEPAARAVLRRALAAAAGAVPAGGGELAVLLTDDAALRSLNRDWRGKDAPTNVLSFPPPAERRPPRAPTGRARADGRAPRLIGDIVIAYETVAREARVERKPFAHHLAHLAVHAFLHLVGYDHAADAEAEAMEAIETAILARLDVPDPYRARSAGA
jgi:probable rRNA maturation factor